MSALPPACRLCVELPGPPVVNLGPDIISIRFGEDLARHPLFEVCVNNRDAGSAGCKYTAGDLLRLGASVRLYAGDITLAEGTIATLAPDFPEASPPTLRFTVTATRPARSPRGRARPAALALTYARELLEFHPVLRRAAQSSRLRIDATGTTAGLPALRPGASVKIAGVGSMFSGTYAVTGTTHAFDSQSGYRTRFVCRQTRRSAPAARS